MAFLNKMQNILKQTASAPTRFGASTCSPSIYQVIRCMSSKLFIGGLSYSTDDISLREAFSRYGEIIEAKVIIDRETGRSRGFGFVTFTSSDEASIAIQGMDGKDLHGRMIRVNHAMERNRGFGGFNSRGGGGPYGSGSYGGSGGDGYESRGGNYSSGYDGSSGYSGGNNYRSGGNFDGGNVGASVESSPNFFSRNDNGSDNFFSGNLGGNKGLEHEMSTETADDSEGGQFGSGEGDRENFSLGDDALEDNLKDPDLDDEPKHHTETKPCMQSISSLDEGQLL